MPAFLTLFHEGAEALRVGDGVALPAVRDGVAEDVLLDLEEVVFVVRPGLIVVDLNPIPLGPMLIVSPSTTMVVGLADGPMSKVVPSMIAWDGPTVTPTSPILVELSLVPGANVVEANPNPSGPMLMVCPSTTTVVGLAEGPMLNVVPSTTACDGPIVTSTSPTLVEVS